MERLSLSDDRFLVGFLCLKCKEEFYVPRSRLRAREGWIDLKCFRCNNYVKYAGFLALEEVRPLEPRSDLRELNELPIGEKKGKGGKK